MQKNRIIDTIDRIILNILHKDGRAQNADIARQLRMAPSGVLQRMRRLRKEGVIQGFEARLDPRSLGRGLLAYVFIQVDEPLGETGTGKEIAKIPEVQEVHLIAGEDCYLVKLRAGSPEDLARLLKQRFGKFKSIRSSRTTIVLHTLKETGTFPFDTTAEK